jgi:hypothetical protein
MSGFLTNLLARSFEPVAAIRPRSPSQFEPAAGPRDGVPRQPSILETSAEETIAPQLSSPFTSRCPAAQTISPIAPLDDQATSKPEPDTKHTETPHAYFRHSNQKTVAAQDHAKNETSSVPKNNRPVMSAPRYSNPSAKGDEPKNEPRAEPVAHATKPHVETCVSPAKSGSQHGRNRNEIELAHPASRPHIRTEGDRSDLASHASQPDRSLPPTSPNENRSIQPTVKLHDRPKFTDSAAQRTVPMAGPEIHVNIACIEVHAATPRVMAARPPSKSEARKEIVSLSDYLKERNAGRRR